MPDIRNFNRSLHISRPFAVFDHMNVLPTLGMYRGFLKVCEQGRAVGIRLHRSHLADEQRAYLAIKSGEYVTNDYEWQR